MDTVNIAENVWVQIGVAALFIAFLIAQDRYYKKRIEEKDTIIASIQDKRVADKDTVIAAQGVVIGNATQAFERAVDAIEKLGSKP